MNSLLKQGPQKNSEEKKIDFISDYEIKINSIKSVSVVKKLFKQLKYLGLNYDPFNAEVSPECFQIIEDLKLSDHLHNPYEATNILLKLLDVTEEKLNQFKN
jgi:hypothetical protein